MAGDMDGSGTRRRGREVVVTGAGVLCHMGDDLPTLEGMLREGRDTPFTPLPAGRRHERPLSDRRHLSRRAHRRRRRRQQGAGPFHGPAVAAGARCRAAGAGAGGPDAARLRGGGGIGRRRRPHPRRDPGQARRIQEHAAHAADRGAAPDGVHRVGEPRERARHHRPVLHDQRGVRRRRLQPAAGGDADRERALRRGRRGRLRGDRPPLPFRVRLDARLQLRGQRSPGARVASLCGRSRGVHLLPKARASWCWSRARRPRRAARDSGRRARVGHVERRRRRHGGALVGWRAPFDRGRAGARRPAARRRSTT